MAKTLGQVAFEAHMLSEDGLTLPGEWAAHDADEQKHWQAAAEAVVAVTTAPNVVSGTIDTKTGNVRIHSPAELTARDKVIEAAKACIKNRLDADKFTPSWWQLKRAVEALQEVE